MNKPINLKAEISFLKKQIAYLNTEIEKFRVSPGRAEMLHEKDLRIINLRQEIQVSLSAAGLAPSRVVLNIEPSGDSFNPTTAYTTAIEAGDKKSAAEIFKAHKAALFSSRKQPTFPTAEWPSVASS